jgi:hypothetical protein
MPDNDAAGASRQTTDSNTFTALGPIYEIRIIALAYGMQFHEDEMGEEWRLDNYIPPKLSRFPDVERVSRTEYINHAQRVIFRILETTDRTVYKTWLETPALHVVYDGHARYGRGPCFGRNGTADGSVRKSDDWEQGTSPSTGIFRLGYKYIGVSVSELLQHGYLANLAKESDGNPQGAECHPEVRAHRHHLRRPEQIHRELTSYYLRDHNDGDRYWVYYKNEEDESNTHLIHKAGWKDTLSKPYELGVLQNPDDPDATTMRCRVFCHFGCSTKLHNFPIVRRVANWRRSGNERFAYWTTAPSSDGTATRWIFNLITYNERNDFENWEPSLEYALARTNRDLRRDRAGYQLY